MSTNDQENDYLVTEEGKQYLQGFNDGYLLAEHLPETIKALDQVKERTPHIEGMINGAQEYAREQVMLRMNDLTPTADQDHSKQDLDKDDKEPELERE